MGPGEPGRGAGAAPTEAIALAKRLAGGPTIALELTKRLANDITREGPDRQIQDGAWAATRGQLAEDAGEGIRSFAERRDPN